MKILITGGCGFVGRRFVRRLAVDGNRVTVVDNMVSGVMPEDWAFPADSKFCRFEYRDVREFFRGVDANTFDLIVHCAAIVGGRKYIDGDPLLVATNMSVDSELFSWCVREHDRWGLLRPAGRTPKVIYFSSSAVYPAQLQTKKYNVLLAESLVDVRQSKVGMPEASYGFSKLAGEYLAWTAARDYGLQVAVYRPFGGYGEDQSLDYPFPAIVKRFIDGVKPVTVWGSGNQLRDFIYIEDIVDAVLATYDKLASAQPLNLGTGYGFSFMNIAEWIGDAAGFEGEITNDASKPEGVFARVADTKALSQWYEAKISIHDGITKMVDFMKSKA